MDLYAELCALVREFDDAGVEYALCGGLAMAVYGIPRATRDIDILARQPDLERIRGIAGERRFTDEILLTPFSGGLSAQRFTKYSGTSEPLTLDILLIGDDGLETVWNSRTRVDFEHGRICVVSMHGLITLKHIAGRPQDLVDIQLLEALNVT